MTPSPLPVQLEELVVVQITNGQADLSVVHLPAIRCNKGGSRFDDFDFTPATWPAACGIGSGSVYVRGGLLEDARVCLECEGVSSGAAVAVGCFSLAGVSGYCAQSGGPLRCTRAEVAADQLRYLDGEVKRAAA